MKIDYKINNYKHKIIFCPDNQGLKIKKQKNSYMMLSKDLKKKYSDQKMIIVFDKKINKKIVRYMVHDLKISFPKITVLMTNGSKANKNSKFFFKLVDILLKKNFSKRSVLISCGGGVIGDVCGLVSALYLRGLVHFHIPTTMTAIIDSCVGGKTAINYRGVINSIGTYYHPENIYISKNILELIPEREYISGIPEILKCALIDNNSTLKMLKNVEKIRNKDLKFVFKIIKTTLRTKIKFFKNDIYEKGQRLKLNFGHTFAHAIEMALDKKNKPDKIRHGEAVGIGILCEIFYANGKNKEFYLTKKILESYNLPTNISKFINKKEIKNIKNKIYANIFLDKKRINKNPRYINLEGLRKTKMSEMKNFKKIKKTIKEIIF